MKQLARALALLGLLLATPAIAADEIPFPDITCEDTATTGTGTVTLTGASAGGYLGFSSQVTTGSSVFYNIVTGTGGSRKVEVGKGVWTSPSTLTRVASWSTDGSATNISLTGTSRVCIDVSGSYFDQGAGSGLNADRLDSKNTGTSGNTVPLLDGNNVASGTNQFSSSVAVSASAVQTYNGIVPNLQINGTTATTSAQAIADFDTTDGNSALLQFFKSGNASIGSSTVVASGEALGRIEWWATQQTGTFATQNQAAGIRATVGTTVTSGASADMPGKLIFCTTPDASGTCTDRLTLDQAGLATFTGNLTVGTSNSITTGTIELGAATDTTIARSGAGDATIEAKAIYRRHRHGDQLRDGGHYPRRAC